MSADDARLDWLDSLKDRVEPLRPGGSMRPVSSKILLDRGRVTIYLRDLRGDVVRFGEGASIREAIDATWGGGNG